MQRHHLRDRPLVITHPMLCTEASGAFECKHDVIWWAGSIGWMISENPIACQMRKLKAHFIQHVPSLTVVTRSISFPSVSPYRAQSGMTQCLSNKFVSGSFSDNVRWESHTLTDFNVAAQKQKKTFVRWEILLASIMTLRCINCFIELSLTKSHEIFLSFINWLKLFDKFSVLCLLADPSQR